MCRVEQPREPLQVERTRPDTHRANRRASLNHLCSEQLAQLRKMYPCTVFTADAGGRAVPASRGRSRPRQFTSELRRAQQDVVDRGRVSQRAALREEPSPCRRRARPSACARGEMDVPRKAGTARGPRAHRVRGGGHHALDAAMTSGRQPPLLDVGVFLGRARAPLGERPHEAIEPIDDQGEAHGAPSSKTPPRQSLRPSSLR